jgi:hypothetical protein
VNSASLADEPFLHLMIGEAGNRVSGKAVPAALQPAFVPYPFTSARLFSLALHRGRKRVKGIEPSYAAWEAAVLPLNYTRG